MTNGVIGAVLSMENAGSRMASLPSASVLRLPRLKSHSPIPKRQTITNPPPIPPPIAAPDIVDFLEGEMVPDEDEDEGDGRTVGDGIVTIDVTTADWLAQ